MTTARCWCLLTPGAPPVQGNAICICIFRYTYEYLSVQVVSIDLYLQRERTTARCWCLLKRPARLVCRAKRSSGLACWSIYIYIYIYMYIPIYL